MAKEIKANQVGRNALTPPLEMLRNSMRVPFVSIAKRRYKKEHGME